MTCENFKWYRVLLEISTFLFLDHNFQSTKLQKKSSNNVPFRRFPIFKSINCKNGAILIVAKVI